MDANDFNHLTPEVQAYIRALEAQNRQLAERVQILEERFRLGNSSVSLLAARSSRTACSTKPNNSR
jgi:hypothetical protein